MDDFAADLYPYVSRPLAVGPFTLRYVDEGPRDATASAPDATGDSGAAGLSTDSGAAGLSTGSGETLLCVHGNPTWGFLFRGVVDRFSASRRVVAVDHLGCGRSDKPPRGKFPYTLAAHRDNLIRLIEEADLRRVTLVAHDWGGAIGLAAMLHHRERLERIVLLNTAAFPPPYVPWRIAACRCPVIGTAAVRGANLFARAAVTMAMSRNRMSPDVARGLLAPYDSWADRVAIDAFVRDIPMSKRHPTHTTLEDLNHALPSLADTPSLLVWGMKDWCFRPECLSRFRQVWPASRSVEIADAGHYVIEDAAEETLEAIDRFLDETPAHCETGSPRNRPSDARPGR